MTFYDLNVFRMVVNPGDDHRRTACSLLDYSGMNLDSLIKGD